MKIHILTEPLDQMQSIATGHTHVAMCLPPSWLSGPVRLLGDSREDARERVIAFIRKQLEGIPLSRDLTEVEINVNLAARTESID